MMDDVPAILLNSRTLRTWQIAKLLELLDENRQKKHGRPDGPARQSQNGA